MGVLPLDHRPTIRTNHTIFFFTREIQTFTLPLTFDPHFNDLFPKLINSAKRENKLVSFFIMDIDFFKQYNDTYGHQKGDKVLIQVADCIKNSLHRADDLSFRLGGEEFGVVEFTDLPSEGVRIDEGATYSLVVVVATKREVNEVAWQRLHDGDLRFRALPSAARWELVR